MPQREEWLREREHPLNRALAIRPHDIGPGFTALLLEPTVDGRVTSFAMTVAADLALTEAVATTIEEAREEMNGTAELNVTFVTPPTGAVTVLARVVERAARYRVIEVEARDSLGVTVARSRGTYIVRRLDGAAEPEPGQA